MLFPDQQAVGNPMVLANSCTTALTTFVGIWLLPHSLHEVGADVWGRDSIYCHHFPSIIRKNLNGKKISLFCLALFKLNFSTLFSLMLYRKCELNFFFVVFVVVVIMSIKHHRHHNLLTSL